MTNENRANIVPRVRYIADGTTTDFFYNFTIFSPEDIDIYADDQLQSQNYQVVIDKENGGKIIFNSAPLKDTIITIIRNLELKRTSDFQENGTFRAKVINHELDYQVASLQQLDEKISRTIIFPPYAPTKLDISLPMPESGKAIIWNDNEDGLVNSELSINTAFKDILSSAETCRSYAAAAETASGKAQTGADNSAAAAETAECEAERAVAAANEATAALGEKANLNLDNITSLSEHAKTKIHTSFGINPSGVIQYAADITFQAPFSGLLCVIAPTGSGNGGFIYAGSTAANLVLLSKIDTVNQGYVNLCCMVAKGQYFQGGRKTAIVYLYPLISGE